MSDQFTALIDPDFHEVLAQLPPEFTNYKAFEEVRFQFLRESFKALEGMPYEHPSISLEEKTIVSQGREVRVFIYRHQDADTHSGAGILWIHGGGNFTGTARDDGNVLPMIAALRCTVVSVDWSLSPEHQHPEGMEDCYAALVWTAENVDALGIDPSRIAIAGESSGGGMAARTVLLNRERKGASVAFQYLKYPMLDNTHDTPSGRLLDHPIWDRESSLWGWKIYLGEDKGKSATPLESPARATDLSGLPPTYINVGTVDLFRDESIAYAQKLLQDGVPTELHVVPGLFHGADHLVPAAPASQALLRAAVNALKRGLKITD